MSKVVQKPISKLVGEYSNAVSRYGLNSDQARRIRDANQSNREFITYANALDRLKKHLRGKVVR